MAPVRGISGQQLSKACFVNGTPEQVRTTGAGQAAEAKKITTVQITNTQDTAKVDRQDLDFGYGVLGVNITAGTKETQEIAKATNDTLKSLNCDYKVSSQQVARVGSSWNNEITPSLDTAMNNATAAHLTSVRKGDITGQEFSKVFA